MSIQFLKRNGHTRRKSSAHIDLSKESVVSTGEVMDMFDTSHSTIMRWIKDGDFPSADVKIRGRNYWKTTTLRNFMNSMPKIAA